MNRTEFINNFWSRYMMMERDFIHLSEYVKIDERNFDTFSNEIIKQILLVNVEFENLLNQMAQEENAQSGTIGNYKTMIFDTLHWDSIMDQQVKVLNTNIILEPFQEWSQSGRGVFWWSAYRELKHDMIANYSKGNFRTLLYSLAALYILELYVIKYIGDKTDDMDVPNDISKLFRICNWETQDHVFAFEAYGIRESEIDDMFNDVEQSLVSHEIL